MKSTIFSFLVLVLASTLGAIEINFGNDHQALAQYSNGTILFLDVETLQLNDNGNYEIYFDYGELSIQYFPSERNTTFSKQAPVDNYGNDETCNSCSSYSCSGNTIPSQGCQCGCTYCCYNSKSGYYLCPSNSAACCSTSNGVIGCSLGTKGTDCTSCTW